MFTISSGLEFWSVNNTSVYKNSQLKNFKIIDFFPVKHAVIDQVSDLEEIDTRFLKLADDHCRQYYNGLILLQ